MTTNETDMQAKTRRDMLLSLLVYPLALWVLLIAISFLIETAGFNILNDDALKSVLILAAIAAVYGLARRRGINAYLLLVGLVGWLVVIVAALFSF